MDSKEIKFAGAIILYNPDIEVVENINSYLHNLDKLYVIDNSEKQNEQLTELIKRLPKILYHNNGANLGIAEALNIACDYAINDGYNWILTMDQDSKIIDDLFFGVVRNTIFNNGGIYAASYTSKYDRVVFDYDTNFDEIHFVITSGNILNLKAYSLAGRFEAKLFIDEVDHDFCIKLKKLNYKILTTKNIYLQHKIGIELETSNDSGLKLHTPVRYYYMTRNILFIIKKYFFVDLKLVLNRGWVLLKIIAKILIYYPHKIIYLKYVWLGVSHFFKGRYGKL